MSPRPGDFQPAAIPLSPPSASIGQVAAPKPFTPISVAEAVHRYRDTLHLRVATGAMSPATRDANVRDLTEAATLLGLDKPLDDVDAGILKNSVFIVRPRDFDCLVVMNVTWAAGVFTDELDQLADQLAQRMQIQ